MHDAAASADSFGESRLEFFASLGEVRDVCDWGGYACMQSNPRCDGCGCCGCGVVFSKGKVKAAFSSAG